MVIVDTSVWISLYRQRDAEMGQMMWALAARNEAAVIGQIWVEFLGGFRERSKRIGYAEALQAYPFIETDRAAYVLAAELLAEHPRLGAGDAIIAATAIRSRVALWTIDRDFDELRGDGLKLHVH